VLNEEMANFLGREEAAIKNGKAKRSAAPGHLHIEVNARQAAWIERGFHIMHEYENNYFHFIAETLPRMLLAEEAVKKGLDKKPELIEQIELMKQSALATAYVQDYFENSPVSDEALKAEYERIKATISGNEYKARHILVESETQAKDIIAKLNKDVSTFEKLAKEFSKDGGSAENGGDLGWFDLGRMVPEFSDAVSKLEKGKFTETPVQSQFGYHVILLDDVRPIEAPPLEEVEPQLSQQMRQQNLEKKVEELKAAAKIDVVGETAAAAEPAAAEPAAQ